MIARRKKLYTLLAANRLARFVLIGLVATLPATLAAKERLYGQGLLWRIEKPGLAPSHVFGTMHSTDERLLQLPKAVIEVFDRSRRCVLETVGSDKKSDEAFEPYMSLSDGRTLRDVVGDGIFEKATRVARGYGMRPNQLLPMTPLALLLTFIVAPEESLRYLAGWVILDEALENEAIALRMDLFGLETVEEQLSLFTSLTKAQRIAALEVAIDENPRLIAEYERQKTLYLRRDLDTLMDLAEESMLLYQNRVGVNILELFLYKRNQTMVERMAEHLAAGRAFIAVGAGHLPGERGILNLLASQGYQITRVH